MFKRAYSTYGWVLGEGHGRREIRVMMTNGQDEGSW